MSGSVCVYVCPFAYLKDDVSNLTKFLVYVTCVRSPFDGVVIGCAFLYK